MLARPTPLEVQQGGGRIFIHKNSKLELFSDIEVPLIGTANNVEIVDTLDFTLGEELLGYDEIKYVKLTLITKNGFPFDFKAQAYLYNDKNERIDVLFPENDYSPITKAGIITGTGNNARIDQQTGRTEQKAEIKVDDIKRINAWREAKYMTYHAYFDTQNNGNSQSTVTFFSDYEIEVRVIAEAKLFIDTDEGLFENF